MVCHGDWGPWPLWRGSLSLGCFGLLLFLEGLIHADRSAQGWRNRTVAVHNRFSCPLFRVGLSRNCLPALRLRDKWQIWDGKRKTCFSASRIVIFLPVQKKFVPAGPKSDVVRERSDKKRHQLKKNRVRERHFLSRNVAKVTRHIFCHQKK